MGDPTAETAQTCAVCGLTIEHVAAMPEYGIEAEWLHCRGRWRVPADHKGRPHNPPIKETPGA